MAALKNSGMTLVAIGEQFGYRGCSVRDALRRFGLAPVTSVCDGYGRAGGNTWRW